MSIAFDDVLSLPYILAWLRKRARKIIAGGVVCAVLAAPLTLYKPKVYESVATLLISPPMFKEVTDTKAENGSIAEMMPPTLPMEAYQALALSPSLLNDVIQEVPIENAGIKELKSRLSVQLIQRGSRTSRGVDYTQTLMFKATASQPEMAARIAQTWAEVFKERIDELASKGVGETFVLLDALHKNTQAQLKQAEVALAEHKKQWNLDLYQAQLNSRQEQLTEFENKLKETEVDLAAGQMKLKALQEELAKEPQKEVFFRAPSDDAYWITAAETGDRKDIPIGEGLRTEEPNPNYVDTRAKIITNSEEVEGLNAKKDALLAKIGEIGNEIDQISATLADKAVEQDQLTREAESLKTSYATVRAEYEKGRIADQTRASDIVIAGRAIVPKTESGLPNPMFIILGGLVGVLLTGGLLAMKDLSEMAPDIFAESSGPAGPAQAKEGTGTLPSSNDLPAATAGDNETAKPS